MTTAAISKSMASLDDTILIDSVAEVLDAKNINANDKGKKKDNKKKNSEPLTVDTPVKPVKAKFKFNLAAKEFTVSLNNETDN